MTKPRDPLAFGTGVFRVGELIGWAAASRLVRRKERTVRHWSETDKKGTPTLEQALALDAAYIAAGGRGAPIFESYTLQVELLLADAVACGAALIDDIATATRETGEAISHSMLVAHPHVTPLMIHRAIAETEEGVGALHRLIARLKGLLSVNGGRWRRAGT